MMAREKTGEPWVGRVRTTYARLKTARERSSAAAVVRALKQEYGEPPGFPSERTVFRLQREYDRMSFDEQREYNIFRWPESMESGALPWEASRDLLDLQRYMLGQGTEIPVRFARCYWRACLAMPDAGIELRRVVASQLAVWAVSGDRPAAHRERLHWYLTYAPWRSPENMTAYLTAIASGAIQRFHADALSPEGTGVGEMMGAQMGIHDPDAIKAVEETLATPLSEQYGIQERLRTEHERKAK